MNTVSAQGPSATFDVLAVGDAIVDVLVHVDDDFLVQEGLLKSSMSLIDEERAIALYDRVGPAIEASGGAAANTAAGIASLGGTARFVGKVQSDQLGQVFTHDLRATGVIFETPAMTSGPATGRSIILMTPDADRTMNTYLGAAAFLGPDDVVDDEIRTASMVYAEGYLFAVPETRAAVSKALARARRFGVATSLPLSDVSIVEHHGDDLHGECREGIDVVIGNEAEMHAMCGGNLLKMPSLGRIVVCTRGEEGSTVVCGDEVVSIPPAPVAQVVDTTGAGDLYAAGFLFGLSRKLSLADCGRMGSIAAAEVISHIGARPAVPLRELAAERA